MKKLFLSWYIILLLSTFHASGKFLHDDECKPQVLQISETNLQFFGTEYAAFETNENILQSDQLKLTYYMGGLHDWSNTLRDMKLFDEFPHLYLMSVHNWLAPLNSYKKYQYYWNFRAQDSNPYRQQWQKDTCQLQLYKRVTDSEWDYYFGKSSCNERIKRNSRRQLSSYLWRNRMTKDYTAVGPSNVMGFYKYDLSIFWRQESSDEEVFIYYDTSYALTQTTVPEGSLRLMSDLYGELDSYQRSNNEKKLFSKWFFMPDRVVREESDGEQYATISLVYVKDTSRVLSSGQWVTSDIIENELQLQDPVRMLNPLECSQEDDGCLKLYNRFRRQDVTSPGCYCLNIVWNEFKICDHVEKNNNEAKTYYTSTGDTDSESCGSPIVFLRNPDADHAVRYFNRLEGITTGIEIEIPNDCMFESNLVTPVDTSQVSNEIFDIPYETQSEHNILNPWVHTLQSNRVATCLKVSLKETDKYKIQCKKQDDQYFLEHDRYAIQEGNYSLADFRYYDNTGKVLPARMNYLFDEENVKSYTPPVTQWEDRSDVECESSTTNATSFYKDSTGFGFKCSQNRMCSFSLSSHTECQENLWNYNYNSEEFTKRKHQCENKKYLLRTEDSGYVNCMYWEINPPTGQFFNGNFDQETDTLLYETCTKCVSGEPDYTERDCLNVLDARCQCPDNQIFGRLSLPEGTELTNAQKYMTGHNTSECISCITCNPLEGFYEEQPCGHQVLYWSGDVSEEIQISNDYLAAGAGYYTVVQDTQCGTCDQSCEAGQYSSCSANYHCQDCRCDFGELGKREAYCYVNTTVCDGTGFQNAGAEVKRFDDIVCEAGFYKNLDSVLDTVGSGEYYKYADFTDRTRKNICTECTLTSNIKTYTGSFVNSYVPYCRGTIYRYEETFRMLNDFEYNESLACNGTSDELQDQDGCQKCPDKPEFSSYIEILECDQADCEGQNTRINNDKKFCDYQCDSGYFKNEEKGICETCDVQCPPGQYRPVIECTNNIQKLPDCEQCEQVSCKEGKYIVKCENGGEKNICRDCEELTCNSDQVLQQCPGNAYEDTSRCVDCGTENTNTLQIPANATARTSGDGGACGFQCNAGFYREENECHMCPTDVLQESCCLDWFAENEGEKMEFCPYALTPNACDNAGVQHGRPGCVCKAGNFLQGDKCTTCRANKFTETDFNHIACKSCKKGKYSNAGSSSCTPCPVNKYRENIGVSQCEVCEPGTSNQTGQYNCETGCNPGEKARAKIEDGYWVQKDTGNPAILHCENVFELASSCLINGTLYCETLEEMRWGYTQETCESSSAFEFSSQEPTYTTECVPCESGYAWSGNFNPFDDSPTEDTSSNGEGVLQDSDASSGSSDTCTGFFCSNDILFD
jgi:hypothetical protein